MSICASSDFIGDVKLIIPTAQATDFSDVITRVERKILIDLLGYDLYVLFIAGLAAGSPHAKWTALKNGADEFLGVKAMLKYFIYAEWINTSNYFHSANGLSANQAENATALTQGQINNFYDRAYNKGVDIYRSAKEWIDDINSPEDITSVSGLTVNTADTKYLVNGDTVTINGEDYVIGGLVADTSFTTSTSVGNATEWVLEFFTDLDYTEKDYSIFAGSL